LNQLLSAKADFGEHIKEVLKDKDRKLDLRKLKESKRELDSLLQAHTKLITVYSSYVELLEVAAGNGKLAQRLSVDLSACPYCQLFRSVKCRLDRISVSSRRAAVNRALEREKSRREDTVKQRQHELSEYESLDRALKNLDEHLRDCRTKIRDINAQIQTAESLIKVLTDEYIKARRRLDEIDERLAAQVDVEHLRAEIKRIQDQRLATIALEEKYTAAADDVAKCKAQLLRLEEDASKKKGMLRKLLDEARVKFNSEASVIMKEIGLRGFKDLSIDEDFHAIIVRSKDGRDFKEKLGELSSSENAAMRILIAFTAKQVYLPEAPIFAMDTITTALDTERFRRLLEYLQDKVPFLVATWLDPEKEQITLVHSIPQL